MRLPRIRTTTRRIMVAVAASGFVLIIAKFLFIDNRPTDMLMAAIDAPAGHFTVYADGYSESKFRSLRVGMSARQVEDIMGPPLTKGQWQDSSGSGPVTPGIGELEDLWHYSQAGRAPGAGNATADYWRREVWFRNGILCRTDRTYSID